MNFTCYVAGPYSSAAFIREHVHARLRQHRVLPTSRWAEDAHGSEDFSKYSPERLKEFGRANDADLRGSDVLFLVDLAGVGRETYAEARFALLLGKPVVWLGRYSLSAWRDGVVRAEDLDHALEILIGMRNRHAEGHRGLMLAHGAYA